MQISPSQFFRLSSEPCHSISSGNQLIKVFFAEYDICIQETVKQEPEIFSGKGGAPLCDAPPGITLFCYSLLSDQS